MSASSDTQFGFNWEPEPPRQETVEEIRVDLAEPPEQAEPEQPALFEGFAPVSKEKEPEIPWAQYTRRVLMFFDGPRFEEFRGQISRLAVRYGTKNLTDTVAEAVRREAH